MTADRVAQVGEDIEASGMALASLLDGPALPAIDPSARIVCTGLGSSRFAAEVVVAVLRSLGRSAWVEIAGSSVGTRPASDVVLLAISASGGTPEVLEAARRHRGVSRVIAVTNRPSGALAGVADEVVDLAAGEEIAGIAGRSFRATIAAVAAMTVAATIDDLRPAIDGIDARLATRADWAPPIVEVLDGAPAIDVLADGTLLGLAEQAALMLRELPRLPAHAAETGDWLHTGVYLAWPGHRILRYPGSAADDGVEATAARRGVTLVDAQAAPGPVIVRAIVDSLIAECVAADLWARATAEG